MDNLDSAGSSHGGDEFETCCGRCKSDDGYALMVAGMDEADVGGDGLVVHPSSLLAPAASQRGPAGRGYPRCAR